MQHNICVGASYDFFWDLSRSLGLRLYDHISKCVLSGRCLALEGGNGGFRIFSFRTENIPRPPPSYKIVITAIIAYFCTLYQSDIENQISSSPTSGVLEHFRAIGQNSKID